MMISVQIHNRTESQPAELTQLVSNRALRHLRVVLCQLIWLIRRVCTIIEPEMAPAQSHQIDKLAA